MNKTELNQILKDALDIMVANESLDTALYSSFMELMQKIDKFAAKILVVGGFSSGKSALLNTFLGNEEILPENITPETAVATELQFGEDEKVIRVAENGNIETSNFEEIREKSADGYSRYIYVLNRSQLQDFKDLTFVDMPGFDSGIEVHNRSLLQYIDEAAAYIFAVDLTVGTLSRSLIKFLNEVKKYTSSIIFILTKSDKLTPDNVEKVREEISAKIEAIMGLKSSLTVTSIYDEGADKKLYDLFSTISADDLLFQKFSKKAVFLLREAVSGLETQLNNLEYDPKEIDEAILRQENHKAIFINKLKQKENQLLQDAKVKIPARILRDIESALKNRMSDLVTGARQGNEAFKSAVVNIIRPVLLDSTAVNIELNVDEYIGSLEEITEDKLLKGDKFSEKFSSVSELFKSDENRNSAGYSVRTNPVFKLLSAVTGIPARVIRPAIEVALGFLPGLLGLISNLFGDSDEEKIRKSIEHKIIPRICENLKPEVQRIVSEINSEQTNAIRTNFQAALDNEIRALELLKRKKEDLQLDMETKGQELQEGINRINALIERLNNNDGSKQSDSEA